MYLICSSYWPTLSITFFILGCWEDRAVVKKSWGTFGLEQAISSVNNIEMNTIAFPFIGLVYSVMNDL